MDRSRHTSGGRQPMKGRPRGQGSASQKEEAVENKFKGNILNRPIRRLVFICKQLCSEEYKLAQEKTQNVRSMVYSNITKNIIM